MLRGVFLPQQTLHWHANRDGCECNGVWRQRGSSGAGMPLSAQGPLGSEAPGLSIKGCYYHCLKYGANPWKQGWATAERGHAQEGQQGSQDTCVYAVLTNMSQTMSRMGSTC